MKSDITGNSQPSAQRKAQLREEEEAGTNLKIQVVDLAGRAVGCEVLKIDTVQLWPP